MPAVPSSSRRPSAQRPRVRVRETRAGKMLIVDGSHASAWRRDHAATGAIWDLLAAPVLLSTNRAPRVLLLGIGGGSVLRVLRALRPRAKLIGVEIDADVLAAARSAFGLDELGAKLVVADARVLVAPARRGAAVATQRLAGAFDLIIDDVYEGVVGAMQKPDGWADVLAAAHARLRPGGLLVANFLHARDERILSRVVLKAARGLRLAHAEYHNRIVVVCRGRSLDAAAATKLMRAEPLLGEAFAKSSVRTISLAPAKSRGGAALTK